MSASPLSPDADMGSHWELSSGASSPRSGTSSNTNSLFSSPDSPTDTEVSFPTTENEDTEKSSSLAQAHFVVTPSFANYVLVGNTPYAPGHIQAMAQTVSAARKTGEFPKSDSAAEEPRTIIEDYQHLKRLRDARGDPAAPPSDQYNILKVDIARRIKARDEMQGAPANFQEVDHRLQNWMSSINKEARMLEITQAALQRKGINNPTQDDLDAIAEEFMQIAERTLLDVANPLRMNATRMEGNMSRFDNQLDGFDGAMTAQLNNLASIMSTLQSTMGTSMEAVTTAMDTSAEAMSSAMGTSAEAMSTAMGAQINTLNTVLATQGNTFNGSLSMLNTALGMVQTDLNRLTTNLPAIIAAAVQAAIKEQLSPLPQQHFPSKQRQSNYDQPPGYATATRVPQYQVSGGELYDGSARLAASAVQVSGQKYEKGCIMGSQSTKSRFRRFLRTITGRKQSNKEAGSK
ncbi:hypothetical protein CTAM01_02290 [Colletotrichum tamarilloi]|uniref:Uncharacterized protein n=1 Tax=Colletotrichum tamarilloi TaxID=1209934 RepID=A0ABQ9RNF3_9PEZI|nr:uncharacterized protein CTAM01_02290 [Colletotrichum tamarilloi]KAK1508504.1 hypothetical protein CTAM01_02290 [Colletotrichum tamarilloi]